MSRRAGRWAAAAAALLLAVPSASLGGAGPARASAADLQLGEEVVLPAVYGDTLPRVTPVLGSTQALAWEPNPASIGAPVPADMRFSLYGGAQRASAGPTRYDLVSLSGTQLASAMFDGGQNTGAKAVDLATGETTRLVETYPLSEKFLTGTGNGWLDVDRYGVRRTLLPSREVTGYGKPAIEGVPDYAVAPQPGAVADPHGALLHFMDDAGVGDPNVNQVFTYLNFDGGGYTPLRVGVGTENSVVLSAMDATTVAWPVGSTLKYFDRADPSAVSSVPLGGGVSGLTVNAGKIAFARAVKDGTRTVYQLRSGPIAGPWSVVTTTLKTTDVVRQADHGDFLVLAGSTVRDYGMYRLHPGATSLGPAVALFGPGAPLGIGASSGRLVSVRPEKIPDAEVRTVRNDAAISDLTVGQATLLAADVGTGPPPDLSGGHGVYVDYARYPVAEAVVLDGTREIARHKIPPGATVTLSGQRLLVSVICPGPDDCYGTETPTAQVIDLDTAKRTSVPYAKAIFGPAIAYVTGTGEIRRRDLLTGAESQVRSPGVPAGIDEFDLRTVDVRMEGDWVLWAVPAEINSILDGEKPAVEAGAVNTVTGARVDLTDQLKVNRPGLADLQLADGVAAWIDSDDREVHVADLSAGVTKTLGVAHRVFENRRFLALSSEFVAWVATDETTHLVALGRAADGPARYLGAVDRAAFSPALAGSAGDFGPQIDVSRPLTSWTMTIALAPAAAPRGSAAAFRSAAVRTLAGTAVTGGVRPVWDGLTASGKRVPDGVYTWTVSGTGLGGALTSASGRPMTGTVRVDTTTPAPRLVVPATASKSAPSNGIAVSWRSAESGVRYSITVAVGTPDSRGRLRWSAAKAWLAGTALKGTYKKAPCPVARGKSYRFTVTATDAAGNRRSSVAVSRVP